MTTISNLSNSYSKDLYKSNKSNKSEIKETNQEVNKEVSSEQKEIVNTNSEYKVDTKTIEAMLEESNRKTEEAKALFGKIFSNQANTSYMAEGTDVLKNIESAIKNYAETGELDFEVSEEVSEQAREDVSEDGYYGVKQTSERILSFAKAISGGDPDKIDLLREAVDEAFGEVEELFGGELPQLSKDTYDAVMKGFDEWANPVEATETVVE